MRLDDPPDAIAWELVGSQGNIPPSDLQEATKWVAYNCDHYDRVKRLKIVAELMRIRREHDERQVRVAARIKREDEEWAEQQKPGYNVPNWGTWG